MPYTKTAIPITKAASAIPNRGDAIIMIDKTMANAPAPMLNALEPALAVFLLFFSSLFPLRPAIMLEMPLNSKLWRLAIQQMLQKQEDMPEQCLKGL
jgi:hypothetical protein